MMLPKIIIGIILIFAFIGLGYIGTLIERLIWRIKNAHKPKTPFKEKYIFTIKKADGTPIPKDEPIFIFRGQDIFSPIVLAFYAGIIRQAGSEKSKVYQDTIRYIGLMRNWHIKKFPD